MGVSRVFLGLGANLGDRLENLRQGVRDLMSLSGTITVEACSRIYETDPVGILDQPRFLNAVVQIQTSLSPRPLLDRCLEIERGLGRERKVKWGPRTLDLDVILFGEEQIDEPGLRVPHANLHERAFVLAPLCDLMPEGVHPLTGIPYIDLLAAAPAAGGVRALEAVLTAEAGSRA